MAFVAVFSVSANNLSPAFADDAEPFTVSNQERRYDGTSTGISYTLLSGPAPTIVYSGAGDTVYPSSGVPPTIPGSYSVTLTSGAYSRTITYTITNGSLNGITFEDEYVLYDGQKHELTVNDTFGATVTYTGNAGTEIGVYRATVKIEKQYYDTIILNAVLYIMGTELVSSEAEAPIVKFSSATGINPSYTAVALDRTQDETLNAFLTDMLSSSESYTERTAKIYEVALLKGANQVDGGTMKISILIPSNITRRWDMRLIRLEQSGATEIDFTIIDNYCVFDGETPGIFAFVTTEATETGNFVARIIVYVIGGIAALLALLLAAGFVSGGYKDRKSKRRKRAKYI